jgi:hypothetical protein
MLPEFNPERRIFNCNFIVTLLIFMTS